MGERAEMIQSREVRAEMIESREERAQSKEHRVKIREERAEMIKSREGTEEIRTIEVKKIYQKSGQPFLGTSRLTPGRRKIIEFAEGSVMLANLRNTAIPLKAALTKGKPNSITC